MRARSMRPSWDSRTRTADAVQLMLAAAVAAAAVDAHATRPPTPTTNIIDVGSVRIQLCTADIVRVQAAPAGPAKPPSPPAPRPGLTAFSDEYSAEMLDNAVCGVGGCPANIRLQKSAGRYKFVRDLAAPVADKNQCASYHPQGECVALYYFYSATNKDNTVARNISREGYSQVRRRSPSPGS